MTDVEMTDLLAVLKLSVENEDFFEHNREQITNLLRVLYHGQIVTISKTEFPMPFEELTDNHVIYDLVCDLEKRITYSNNEFIYAREYLEETGIGKSNSIQYIKNAYGFYSADRIGRLYTEDGISLADAVSDNWQKTKVSPIRFLKDMPVDLELDEACMLARIWTYNYAEFFFSSLFQMLAMEENGYAGKYLLVYSEAAEQLVELMGISPERIIFFDEADAGKVIEIRKAAIPNFTDDYLSECFIRWKKGLFDNKRDDNYPRKLCIKRIGTRKPLNLSDIAARNGFFEMIPEEWSVYEQMCFFHNADIIIAPHGAGNANFALCRENTAVIETFPSGWINPCFMKYVKLSKLKYQMVVEKRLENWEEKESNQLADYYLEESQIQAAIDNAVELSQM